MWGFSMIIRSHLTKMICNIKRYVVVACILIILQTNKGSLGQTEIHYVFLSLVKEDSRLNISVNYPRLVTVKTRLSYNITKSEQNEELHYFDRFDFHK